MGAGNIDRGSAVPLYQQIADDLRERIRAGELTSKMPSWRDVAMDYHVALDTARKAVSVLIAEGLVVAYKGKGTQVKPPD